MRRSSLAKLLIDAPNDAARRRLLLQFPTLIDERLAAELRKACYAAWTVEPVRAQRAAKATNVVAAANATTEITATAAWVRGIAEITKGRFEPAVAFLDKAASVLENETDAAEVQVARLLALAMLGRYDEAIEAGGKALKVFAAGRGNDVAAAKIEMNLSNVVSRQGRHRQAEKYGLSALRRFTGAGEKTWQAMAENSLANTYSDLNDLDKAERYYRQALASAHAQKMAVTEAEIEASLGNLATLRGRYGDALRSLESSRQRYDDLGMPHQSAVADLEIGDIYLTLNLLAEAAEIYGRVSAAFSRLKMRAEEARARLNFGQSLAKLGRSRAARAELDHACRLFRAERNTSGETAVQLAQAELALTFADHHDALTSLQAAAKAVRSHENPRHQVRFALLEGQALAMSGKIGKGARRLSDAAKGARKHEQPAALQAALHSLGRVSLLAGDKRKAQAYLASSIDVIEDLRSPIAAGEFGIAFFGSRLGPYEDLARLLLGDGKTAEAFKAIEKGRSRALLDALGRKTRVAGMPAKLVSRAAELRAELNFRYKDLEGSTSGDAARIQKEIGQAESGLAKVNRQIASLSVAKQRSARTEVEFDVISVQAALGDRILIEFVEVDGEISAFVIDKNTFRYVDGLGTTEGVDGFLGELHFQFGALRYGGAAVSRFAGQLKQRANACLGPLYDQLLRPLGDEIKNKRLVIVPFGPLHYVPFAALHNGEEYLVQRSEITVAPSAAVWRQLQRRRRRKIGSSLLMAYADERIPLVENEVDELSKIVPEPTICTGREATFARFTAEAGDHDLIHLACHGQFRPDNPMFSNLHLADGWITVQDLTARQLKAKLVTLSACETGLSKVFPGDELLGLARGFLAAGAASLVVSLWTVNDEAAARLMKSFYVSLQRGKPPAASLMDAQNELIAAGSHPYRWAPFIVIG